MQKLLFQIAAAALFITVMRVLGYLSPDLYIPFVRITLPMPDVRRPLQQRESFVPFLQREE